MALPWLPESGWKFLSLRNMIWLFLLASWGPSLIVASLLCSRLPASPSLCQLVHIPVRPRAKPRKPVTDPPPASALTPNALVYSSGPPIPVSPMLGLASPLLLVLQFWKPNSDTTFKDPEASPFLSAPPLADLAPPPHPWPQLHLACLLFCAYVNKYSRSCPLPGSELGAGWK